MPGARRRSQQDRFPVPPTHTKESHRARSRACRRWRRDPSPTRETCRCRRRNRFRHPARTYTESRGEAPWRWSGCRGRSSGCRRVLGHSPDRGCTGETSRADDHAARIEERSTGNLRPTVTLVGIELPESSRAGRARFETERAGGRERHADDIGPEAVARTRALRAIYGAIAFRGSLTVEQSGVVDGAELDTATLSVSRARAPDTNEFLTAAAESAVSTAGNATESAALAARARASAQRRQAAERARAATRFRRGFDLSGASRQKNDSAR
jgi:hypothetical protein